MAEFDFALARIYLEKGEERKCLLNGKLCVFSGENLGYPTCILGFLGKDYREQFKPDTKIGVNTVTEFPSSCPNGFTICESTQDRLIRHIKEI
jgi:hypothetical protein